eukprot:c18926_g1_i1.p1 GENE.c18926_g1_i1~~c18926_g1_i1.p1  ORF type:complete len:207 (+),score=37.36 c18926_g1_i1:182-802(+)
MRVGSTHATLFHEWFRFLSRIGSAETAKSFVTKTFFITNLLNNSVQFGVSDPACLNVKTLGQFQSCPAFAAAALGKAATEVQDEFGRVRQRWGLDRHLSLHRHPILNQSPLRCLSDRGAAHGGDQATPNVGTYDIKTFRQQRGPSYRHIVDLGDLDQSLFVNPLGNSGDLLSLNYDSFRRKYAEDAYFPMVTKALPNSRETTLTPK